MSAHPPTGAGGRSGWQIALTVLGAALVIAGGVLEFDILHHSSSTVVRRLTGNTAGTVTTVSAAAPATSLVATCLGAGIVLLLVAAFFSRITKIAIDNVGEIDLATVSKLADKSAQVRHPPSQLLDRGSPAYGQHGRDCHDRERSASRHLISSDLPGRRNRAATGSCLLQPHHEDRSYQRWRDRPRDGQQTRGQVGAGCRQRA